VPDDKTGLVIAHTPDDAAYHPGLNAYGTTIPRAGQGGGSRGFDPHKPGLVIIDPDMEDGNLEVDFSKFSEVEDLNNIIQNAAGATPSSEGAFQAYSNIASELAEGGKKTSPPLTSSVLKKESSGMNKPKLRKPAPTPVPVATELPDHDRNERATEALLGEQAELIRRLTSEVAELQKDKVVEDIPPPPPVEQEPEVEPEADLGMPFLGFASPLKPQKEIYFEMPQAGTMGARYHEVIEGSNCIALVYDTRYEDGYQWIPPALGDAKITMTLPRENKTYICSSVGIHFHVGVLDVVVLFKHDSDATEKDY
jgi:hypothetical protein